LLASIRDGVTLRTISNEDQLGGTMSRTSPLNTDLLSQIRTGTQTLRKTQGLNTTGAAGKAGTSSAKVGGLVDMLSEAMDKRRTMLAHNIKDSDDSDNSSDGSDW